MAKRKAKKPSTPTRSKSLRVPLPDDWRAAIEDAAAAEGLELAPWVRDAIAAKLPASVRRTLSPVRMGRPSQE